MIASSSSHRKKFMDIKLHKGFSLAEMAVALVIIGLLLAGALMPISTQLEVRNNADTRRSMEQIREAIIGYAQTNGRLPCPANGTLASGAAGAGSEQWDSANSRCTTSLGVVPWGTLGVPETDAWGRRFSYRVTHAFSDAINVNPLTASYEANMTLSSGPANANLTSPGNQSPACVLPTPTPALSSFALCSLGDIAVFTRNDTTHNVSPVGSGIPAIIISHGKNGYGAFQTNGTRAAAPNDGNSDGVPDQNTDEAANASGTTTLTPASGYTYTSRAYYNRNATPAAAGCSDSAAGSAFCEFDDIVVAISPTTLITRMISAGRLP
jgi:prepilin-type N-terminal cleavage/methylation domain-containing protein